MWWFSLGTEGKTREVRLWRCPLADAAWLRPVPVLRQIDCPRPHEAADQLCRCRSCSAADADADTDADADVVSGTCRELRQWLKTRM